MLPSVVLETPGSAIDHTFVVVKAAKLLCGQWAFVV